MRRLSSSPWQALALLCWLMAAAVGGARADKPAPEARSVDHALLEELAVEQRLVSRMPEPGMTRYVQDTALRLTTRLAEWVRGWFGDLAAFAGAGGRWFLLILFVALGGLIVLLLVRALVSRRRRRRVVTPVVVREVPEAETGWGEVEWEATLRRRIEEGAGAEAATALWWWVASRLVPTGADPGWTSRELLQKADRHDLAGGLRSLDRLLYGAVEPMADEVAQLWGELREPLA